MRQLPGKEEDLPGSIVKAIENHILRETEGAETFRVASIQIKFLSNRRIIAWSFSFLRVSAKSPGNDEREVSLKRDFATTVLCKCKAR
jgi:hypothetical protein